MSAYYLAHLIAAVHDHPRTGDWWWEVQYKFRAAHIALGEPELCDNDGNIWTFNDATPGGEVYTKS